MTGFLTLSLVCSWLFWGILTSTTTLLADFQYASAEYSVSQKFGYTFDSDLENALPCLDGKDVVKLMNTARMSIAAAFFSTTISFKCTIRGKRYRSSIKNTTVTQKQLPNIARLTDPGMIIIPHSAMLIAER